MTFQFSCPQGHILQGELSQVGQLFQCPFCGESFSIPSPDPHQGGEFMQGLPSWPGGQSLHGYPQQGYPDQPIPNMAFPAQAFPNPAVPMPMQASTPAQPKQEAAEPAADQPRFVLDFDPHAKAPLPFDMPGGPGDKFSFDKPPAAPHAFSGEGLGPLTSPLPTTPPLEGAPDSTHSPNAAPTDFAALADEPKKAKVLHVRCPAGHALKVNADRHGKPVRCSVCKQVFEVRYENSLEFQRRTEKVVSRAKAKEGQTWLAWAIFAAFVAIAGLVALIVYANRG